MIVIWKYTRNVYYIGNLEFARLTPGEAHFFNLDGEEIEKQTTEIKWNAEAAEKAGFEHFMMNEIHEQPKAVKDTLAALRLAKEKGITTLAIVNVVGSSIACEADKIFYTLAELEISVATTKDYNAQLTAMYCLTVHLQKSEIGLQKNSTAITFLSY